MPRFDGLGLPPELVNALNQEVEVVDDAGNALNIAQPKNVAPSPTVAVNTIYARTTGNDDSGDGTLASPYATFVRALQDVPLHIFSNERYVVDITGITEDLEGFNVPPITAQSDYPEYDVAAGPPWLGLYGKLHILATPQLTHTITAGEISAQNADANTGLHTIVTTNSYTPDELKGKFLIGAGVGEWSIVTGNTATDIETTNWSEFTAPIELYDPGATLENTDAGSYYAPIRSMHQHMAITFAGIRFELASGSAYRSGLYLSDAGEFLCACCHFEGISTTRNAYLQVWYSYFRNKNISLSSDASFGSCLFDNTDFKGSGSIGPRGEVELFACRLLGCDGAGRNTSAAAQSPGLIVEIASCEIRDSVGDAVVMGNGALEMSNCNIINAAGWAVRLRDGATAKLTSVKGTGNTGGGLLVEGGSQMKVDADCDVNAGGTNEIKVGDEAAITWTTFRTTGPPYNKVDATVQLARLVLES